MAKASQVLKAALQRILVQASEAPLEADEYQDAIFSMNNYMLALDAEGISLGYTEVSSLGDDITVPTGALRGIIANVAIEISPDYGGVVSPGLVKAAEEGLRAMRHLGQRMGASEYPSTLPLGAGLEGTRGWRSTHFFPELENQILAETTGAIGLETNTNTVADA